MRLTKMRIRARAFSLWDQSTVILPRRLVSSSPASQIPVGVCARPFLYPTLFLFAAPGVAVSRIRDRLFLSFARISLRGALFYKLPCLRAAVPGVAVFLAHDVALYGLINGYTNTS